MLLGDNGGISTADGRTRPIVVQHTEMESYLGCYAGLIIYLKEMDESIYAKLCAVRVIYLLKITSLSIICRPTSLRPVNSIAHK